MSLCTNLLHLSNFFLHLFAKQRYILRNRTAPDRSQLKFCAKFHSMACVEVFQVLQYDLPAGTFRLISRTSLRVRNLAESKACRLRLNISATHLELRSRSLKSSIVLKPWLSVSCGYHHQRLFKINPSKSSLSSLPRLSTQITYILEAVLKCFLC